MIYRSICHKASFRTRLPDVPANLGRTNYQICDRCKYPCGVALMKDQPRQKPGPKKKTLFMEIVR